MWPVRMLHPRRKEHPSHWNQCSVHYGEPLGVPPNLLRLPSNFSTFFHSSLLHQSGVDGVSRASERGTESLDVLQQRGGEPGEGRADRPPASLDLSLLTLCLLYSTASTATTPANVVVSPSPLSFFLSHHHGNDNSNDRHRRRNNHYRCSQRSHSPNCVQANSAPSCPVPSVGDNSFTAFPECIEA